MPTYPSSSRARTGLSNACAAGLLLALAPAAGAATIALSGQPAPGTTRNFFSFTGDYGVIPYTAGVTPGAGNRVSFLGSLENASPFSDALYTGSPGALNFIFQRGLTQAPGYPPDTAIAGYSPIALFPSGNVAFFATVQFPVAYPLYYGAPGALSIVVQKGDPAPGLPGVIIGDVSPSFSPYVNGSNLGAFYNLTGAVTPATDVAFFAGPPGALVPVMHEGDTAPGFPGAKLDSPNFSLATMNASAHVLFSCGTVGPGINVSSLWIGGPTANTYTFVARGGLPPPGLPGGTLQAIYESFINNAGQVAFRGDFGNIGLFGGFPNSLALIARPTFTPAPGASPGASFQTLFDMRLNGAGRVAFYAMLNPPDSKTGLWITAPLTSTASPALTLVAIDGMQAPGVPAGVLFNGIAFSGHILNMNKRGDLVFNCGLSGPGVNSTNDSGLWAGSPGHLRLVVRKGDPFTVAPGDTRTIAGISNSSVSSSGGEDGLRSPLNDLGQLTFVLSFTDNSYGLFVVQLAHPCPGDTNGDGVIDFADLNVVLSNFGLVGPPGFPGDYNNDGVVNFLDLNVVLSFFGFAC